MDRCPHGTRRLLGTGDAQPRQGFLLTVLFRYGGVESLEARHAQLSFGLEFVPGEREDVDPSFAAG